MSYTDAREFKVTAADGTTATLAPLRSGAQPAAIPSQIVLTFAATPAEFAVNREVSIRISTDT